MGKCQRTGSGSKSLEEELPFVNQAKELCGLVASPIPPVIAAAELKRVFVIGLSLKSRPPKCI